MASQSGSSRVPLTMRHLFFQDPFFESNWAEFDKIRQDMMRDSQEFWSRAGSFQGHPSLPPPPELLSGGGGDGGAALSPLVMPKRWMLPRFLSRDESDKMFPADFFGRQAGSDDDQVLKIKDSDGGLEVSLDTHEYRPDELKVTVEGGMLKVEAKHEEKGEGKFVSRQFSRSFTLPSGCDATKVVSNLSSDGILMISAPREGGGVGAHPAVENK